MDFKKSILTGFFCIFPARGAGVLSANFFPLGKQKTEVHNFSCEIHQSEFLLIFILCVYNRFAIHFRFGSEQRWESTESQYSGLHESSFTKYPIGQSKFSHNFDRDQCFDHNKCFDRDQHFDFDLCFDSNKCFDRDYITCFLTEARSTEEIFKNKFFPRSSTG